MEARIIQELEDILTNVDSTHMEVAQRLAELSGRLLLEQAGSEVLSLQFVEATAAVARANAEVEQAGQLRATYREIQRIRRNM